jgi:predicted RNase H-like nuclease (RuvC/YqgF family)
LTILQTKLSQENVQLADENRELERRYQNSRDALEKQKEEESHSSAGPTNLEEMKQMTEQMNKLRRQLRSSQIATKQLQGENQLLKDAAESVSQRPSTHSLKSVLLIDECFQLLL